MHVQARTRQDTAADGPQLLLEAPREELALVGQQRQHERRRWVALLLRLRAHEALRVELRLERLQLLLGLPRVVVQGLVAAGCGHICKWGEDGVGRRGRKACERPQGLRGNAQSRLCRRDRAG